MSDTPPDPRPVSWETLRSEPMVVIEQYADGDYAREVKADAKFPLEEALEAAIQERDAADAARERAEKENQELRAELGGPNVVSYFKGKAARERADKDVEYSRKELAAANRHCKFIQAERDVAVRYGQQRDREIAVAMQVLAPNIPESGLEDACRQVKQAAISAMGNCEELEKLLERAEARATQAEAERDEANRKCEYDMARLIAMEGDLLEQRDRLREALTDILAVIEADDLIPETVSYMRQARAALTPPSGVTP